jgi:hypothetical protein
LCTISFTCITDVVIPADIINEFDEWDLEVIRVWSGEVQVILDNNGRQLIFDNVRQSQCGCCNQQLYKLLQSVSFHIRCPVSLDNSSCQVSLHDSGSSIILVQQGLRGHRGEEWLSRRRPNRWCGRSQQQFWTIQDYDGCSSAPGTVSQAFPVP